MNQSLKLLVVLVVGIVIGAALALSIVWLYENNLKVRPKELQNAVTAPTLPRALPKFKFLPKVRIQGLQGSPIAPALPDYNPAADADPMPGLRTN